MTNAPEWQRLNRVYVGQLESVNEDDGTASVVVLDGLFRKEGSPTAPVIVPITVSVRRFDSSWVRYMPRRGDLVYVAYGAQNQPFILGLALYGDGARQLRECREAGDLGLNEFRKLRGGEWDMRSSGGAYLYGSADGDLLLSSAQVFFRLDRRNDLVRGGTGLWALETGTGSYLRFGDIKRRLLPTDAVETDLSSVASIAPSTLALGARGAIATALSPLVALDRAAKEWRVHIETDTLAVNQLIADDQLGAVRDGAGTPVMSTSNPLAPVRHRKRIFAVGSTNLLPLNAFTSEIDELGNVRVQAAAAIGGTEVKLIGGPTAALSTSFLTSTISSTALTVIDSPLTQLGSTAAVEPLLKGTTTTAVLATHATTLAAAAAALAGAMSTIAGLEGGPTSVKGTAFTTAAAAATAIAASATALAGSLPTTLSLKVFTE